MAIISSIAISLLKLSLSQGAKSITLKAITSVVKKEGVAAVRRALLSKALEGIKKPTLYTAAESAKKFGVDLKSIATQYARKDVKLLTARSVKSLISNPLIEGPRGGILRTSAMRRRAKNASIFKHGVEIISAAEHVDNQKLLNVFQRLTPSARGNKATLKNLIALGNEEYEFTEDEIYEYLLHNNKIGRMPS